MKKFIIGLLLSIISILLPVVLLFLGVVYSNVPCFVGAGVTTVIYFMFREPIGNLLADGRQDVEYDEFGRSKRKNFKRLSRTEQDAVDLQKTADLERLLSSTVIKRITKQGSEAPEKDLESMIGLTNVKTKVNEMSARMKFERESNKGKRKKDRTNSMSGRHFVFFGSAGTGKTQTARIITGFLYKYGYIKENKCIEIDGNFLKAGEDSATKTRLITQKAHGGVLFIDEAYTIIDGSGGYGKEVVATLIKEMEDNRDKLIVILAGYKNDIKRLLDSNEGFKSRIKEYLEFPDYNAEEMKEIFVSMAHAEGYAVTAEALENFNTRCAKERKLSSFGNGRTARNILDETLDRHALNFGQGKLMTVEGDIKRSNADNKFRICGCDVSTSVNKATL